MIFYFWNFLSFMILNFMSFTAHCKYVVKRLVNIRSNKGNNLIVKNHSVDDLSQPKYKDK